MEEKSDTRASLPDVQDPRNDLTGPDLWDRERTQTVQLSSGTLTARIYAHSYEIILALILLLHYGAILCTNSFLDSANIVDFVDTRSNTIQTAALNSANLPVFYLFGFLVNTLHLSNASIKMAIVFFCLFGISYSVYKICIHIFKSELSGILAVGLFLYSSLFFAPLFANINFIDDSNPDALSFTFLLLGILCWIRGRHLLSSMLFGFSFDCHPILPIGCILAFYGYQLVYFKTVKVRNILLSVIIFVVVTSPVLFSILRSIVSLRGLGSSVLDGEMVWKYVAFAQPQSAFIDVIPGFHYGMALYLAAFLVLLMFMNWGDVNLKRQYSAILFIVFFVFAITVLEIANSRYFKILPLYNLWFHRFLSYGSLMNYIVLAGGAFCVINNGLVNTILRRCLFLLLVYSFFSYMDTKDLFMTYWANHFYILELVIVYYIYNFVVSFRRNRLRPREIAINVFFLAGSLVYLIYLSTYNRFKPADQIVGLFTKENFMRFFEVIGAEQFQYPAQYEFEKGFYVLLGCLILFGIADVFERLRKKARTGQTG
jgi:hypothetical protein